MSGLRCACVSLTGFAVEWGWAVGESAMIPHLLAPPLRLAPAVAGLLYTVNPIFSFIIAPLVGRCADGSRALDTATRAERALRNRRRFVAALAVIGLGGIGALAATPAVADRRLQAALCFATFGVVDLCHDLILVPGRSLLVAMWRGAGGDDDADAAYSLSQLVGRCLALATLGAMPRAGLRGTSFFQTLWAVSAAVLAATTVAALAATGGAREGKGADDDGAAAGVGEASETASVTPSAKKRPSPALILVLWIQFLGWVGIMCIAFWSTTWLGLGTRFPGTRMSLPLLALATQTLSGVLVGPFLPTLNRLLGAARVWLGSELVLLGSLAAARWLGPDRPAATVAVWVAGGSAFTARAGAESQPLFLGEPQSSSKFPNAVKSNSFPAVS